MSWSVNLIGKPAAVAAALEEESGRLTDQSKVEFDAAKPHLVALVLENFANAEGYTEPIVQLEASGHGYARETEQVQRNLQVKLTPLYGKLV